MFLHWIFTIQQSKVNLLERAYGGMADTLVLGTSDASRGGSSPSTRTNFLNQLITNQQRSRTPREKAACNKWNRTNTGQCFGC